MGKRLPGEVFKELRERIGISMSAFADVGISKMTISNFERDKKMMSCSRLSAALEKMEVPVEAYWMMVSGEVVNPRPGQLFRELREQRELEISDFQEIGLSKIGLELFEEGKYDLGGLTLEAALDFIYVPLQDYANLLNNRQSPAFLKMFDEIEEADSRGDVEKLEQIYDESKANTDAMLISLSAKSCFIGLTEEELLEINSLFFGLDHLTNWELLAFIFTVNDLPTSTIKGLANDVMRKFAHQGKHMEYHFNLLRAGIKASYVLIGRGEKHFAQSLLALISRSFLDNDVYLRILYGFTMGYYSYAAGQEDGIDKMKEMLAIAKTVGGCRLYMKLQRVFDLMINGKLA
jgi:Rgg/GadR/MutR family transcriptional activator